MKTKTNGKYINPSSHTGPYTEYVCDELIRGDGEPVIASRCCPYDCPGNRPPVDADSYDKAVDELIKAAGNVVLKILSLKKKSRIRYAHKLVVAVVAVQKARRKP